MGYQRAVWSSEKDDLSINESPVSPNQLAGVISLIQSGDISGKIAKELFEIVYSEGGDPTEIVEKLVMKQVTDTSAIEQSVEKVIMIILIKWRRLK